MARIADDPREAGVVYAWKHPQTGDIRYVGKTRNLKRRLSQYRHDFAKNTKTQPHLRHWVMSLKRDGIEPECVVLETCDSRLSERERWWIAEGRRQGWQLCNLTSGGDGGHDFDSSTLMTLRDKSKAQWQTEEYRQRRIEAGCMRSPEQIAEEDRQQEAKRKVQRLVDVAGKAWKDCLERMGRRKHGKARIQGDIARIPLLDGRWAIVDTEDAGKVAVTSWRVNGKGRVVSSTLGLLARVVMGDPAMAVIANVNKDPLDCRKANLLLSPVRTRHKPLPKAMRNADPMPTGTTRVFVQDIAHEHAVMRTWWIEHADASRTIVTECNGSLIRNADECRYPPLPRWKADRRLEQYRQAQVSECPVFKAYAS